MAFHITPTLDLDNIILPLGYSLIIMCAKVLLIWI